MWVENGIENSQGLTGCETENMFIPQSVPGSLSTHQDAANTLRGICRIN